MTPEGEPKMARRRRNTHTTPSAQRVVSTPTLTPLLTPSHQYLKYLRHYRAITQQTNRYREHTNAAIRTRSYIDRRRYHPDAVKPAGATKRNASRLVARGPYKVAFAIPSRVAVCARRKIRREVLHAYRIAGSSGSGHRKRRRNFWSDVRC